MPTEKEKMLAGQVYNPGQDEELVTELTACKANCRLERKRRNS